MGAEPGASHAKRGRPSPATLDLLARSHATLRAELADLLAELRPDPVESRTLSIGDPMPPARPALADRVRLVELIGKIMALLGTEIVPAPAETPGPAAPGRAPRGRRIDYG